MRERSSRRTEAVATTTGYIINLGIAAVVVTMLLMHAQGVVGDLSETTTETELEVTADRISATITEADKLHRMSQNPDGEVPLELHDLVSGDLGSYRVNVSDADPGETGSIVIRPTWTTREIEVETEFNARTEVHGKEFTSAEGARVIYNETGIHFI